MQALGQLIAHANATREDVEEQLRAMAPHIPREARGETIDFLLWVAQQAHDREAERLEAARARVRTVLWPLAAAGVPLTHLLTRAHAAASEVLRPAEVELLVDEVLASAEGRWRRDVL